jgi:hypothetical protein
MATKGKTKKTYKKPKIIEVKLEMEEAVLQACKHFNGDSTGKGNKTCGTNSCKMTYGS